MNALSLANWPFFSLPNSAVPRGEEQVTLSRKLSLCRGLWLAAYLAQERFEGAPVAVVLESQAQAQALCAEIRLFAPLVGLGAQGVKEGLLHLPEVEGSPYADVASDPRQVADRLGALARLYRAQPRLLVLSADSLRRKVLAPELFSQLAQRFEPGMQCERDEAVQKIRAAGYLKVDLVEDAGTYAVRGNVVDVFSPAAQQPVRIEWWGDEIDKIKSFDPKTQRSLRALETIDVLVTRESIVSDQGAMRERLFLLADRLEVPSSQSRRVLEHLQSGAAFFGMEALVPICHESYRAVDELLSPDTRWIAMEPLAVQEKVDELWQRDQESFALRRAEPALVCEPGDFFVEQSAVRQRLERAWISIQELESEPEWLELHSNIQLRTELQGARAQKREDWHVPLLQALKSKAQLGWDIVLALSTQSQCDRLFSLLESSSLAAHVLSSERASELATPSKECRILLRLGELEEGFRLHGPDLWLLSERDIFGQRAKASRPRKRFRKEASLAALSEGDFVVHITHGVGRYHGLSRLDLAGVDAEFVLVEYANKDRLYLPVHRVNEIEAYGSVEGKEPKLDRLGGVSFATKTKKVRADARMLAEELLTLYAQREAQNGFAFPPLGAAMQDFAATFPYEPTPDQAQAIEATLRDLQSRHPMDRLICGDVGFGKTEVALRASFFVASHNKQVAMLAPTTILAQQHLHTFRRRMANFPLEIAAMHRFVPSAERKDTLQKLREGKIDVIVGTHALLSSEVQFKDLGLVVVDEEQRFGVRQKERFKRMKTKVDMLTLSATPIPRTLHMGLMGMREISMIMTPPSDRLSVRTKLAKDSDSVIQEGIAQELARGGQVFYVVPRIEGITAQARRIQALAPDARVALAHGNMTAAALEKVMLDFVEYRFDILVCTTIVESGLDIPRANTIFIARADQFGMSQLYQLRGRVGRSRLRAYCFLLVQSLEKLSKKARHRLDAIVMNCELGAGFSVASQDLELRGAGDLLGRRQSGSIAKVGFQAYARALEEAVAETRGLPVLREEDPELNIDIPAFLPAQDIEDTGQRIELYRRLGAAQDPDALNQIVAEMHDRYGKLSIEAQHYGLLMLARLHARRAGLSALDLRGQSLGMILGPRALENKGKLVAWVARCKGEFRWASEQKITAKLPERTGEDCSRQLRAAASFVTRLDEASNSAS